MFIQLFNIYTQHVIVLKPQGSLIIAVSFSNKAWQNLKYYIKIIF